MKLNYFLRGLGTGILFCAIILFVANLTDRNKNVSEEYIREEAKKLGMVEEVKEDDLSKILDQDSQANQNNVAKKEDTQQKNSEEKVSTEAKSENTTEAVTEATEEKTTEEKTTEKATETKKKEEEKKETNKQVTITIKSGMYSNVVAQMLKKKGVIDDVNKFDNYLNKHGYANRIAVGTYKIKIGASYAEIAKIIVGEK